MIAYGDVYTGSPPSRTLRSGRPGARRLWHMPMRKRAGPAAINERAGKVNDNTYSILAIED